MSDNEKDFFYYTINHRIRNQWPGTHKSMTVGPGNDFYSVVPFSRHPDPRRIDIRTTLRDPFRELYIKQFRQRSRLPVSVVIDSSASMNFANRLQEVERFIRTASFSAAKLKDPFSCFVCSDKLHQVQTHEIEKLNLTKYFNSISTASRQKSDSLTRVYERLSSKGSLVFFISDFHLEHDFLLKIFHSLKKHWLVPVVIWTREERRYPRWGITKLEDAEEGKTKTILLTPRSSKLYRQAWLKRRQYLEHLFSQSGLSAFFIENRFSTQKMTEYFCSR